MPDLAYIIVAIVLASATAMLGWRLGRRPPKPAHAAGADDLKLMVEAAPDAVYVLRESRVILANSQAAALLGATSVAELIGRDESALLVEDSRAQAALRRAALSTAGDRTPITGLTYRRLDGGAAYVETTAAAFLLDGEVVVQVACRDVTARQEAERALRERTAELETVMETVPVAVWLAQGTGAPRILGNRRAAQLLRLPVTENLSLTAPPPERPAHFRVFKNGREVPSDRLPMQRATRGELVRNEELRVRFDDGSFYDELVNATPIRDQDGTIVGAVGAAVDISDRKAAEEQIRHMALHDPLTGLPNRVLFQDRLANALARARRHGSEVAVMLLDLDHFKDVNDTLGHSVGDKLLREVASRLSEVARASDTWARLGGDEFALVQEGLRGSEGASVMAARVLAALDAPFRIDGHELEVAGSLGVTIYPTDGDSAERLVRNADVALYRAKAAGRGRFAPYHGEFDRELRRDRRLQRELRRALAGDALELAYQPVFSLPRQRLVKVEALVRWPQSGSTPVPPSTFIPLAERSGLIHPLGEWVLSRVCQQSAAWCAAGQPLRTAVNVSAAQLRHAGFVPMLARLLNEAGVAPDLLELELTESVFVDGAREQIRGALHEIAAMGVALTIDDYGTGHSSLTHLRQFPFDELKIDASFVADIGRDPSSGAIVAAVIGLAHSLGKLVTAEGVETAEQLEFLRERGCDAAQGYLLARPGPASSLLELRSAVA